MNIRLSLPILALSIAFALPFPAKAQDSRESDSSGSGTAESSQPESPELGAPAATSGDGADRTRLNLLGEVNTEQGEGRRNENVRLTLIDNNVLRELNERLGISATAVKSFQIDRSYWATEYGRPA